MSKIEIKKTNKLVDYESSLKFMQLRVNQIQKNYEKELIWFLYHDHIYTQGTSSKINEIIKKNEVRILQTNRGGKTTYHGPGQRIIYFLINLNNRKKDIRRFITIIEDSLITFLGNKGIEARSFKDRVGIWVLGSKSLKFDKERKIGAIGIRVSKWVTYHGLSFNIKPDLKYYEDIHSCGLQKFKNTSLEQLGINIREDEFDDEFKNIFLKKLSEF